MPKEMEENLKKEAAKKGYFGKRADRYVYGTMNKRGFMRGNKRTKRTAQADAVEKI